MEKAENRKQKWDNGTMDHRIEDGSDKVGKRIFASK
jgi:hypothetical protein